ncbi:HD-GYP domain-containing protein [Paenibacillus sp. TRM 82003]|nr:HD-GYP domain-containing protein [Paenibacillus sp. TRM 82003]
MKPVRTHITNLHTGEKFIEDVFTSFGLHVISAGTIVTDQSLSLLFRHQIEYVEIETSAVVSEPAFPEPIGTKLEPHPLQGAYDKTVTQMKRMFDRAFHEGNIVPEELEQSYNPLVESIQQERDVVGLLLSLNSNDDYTYEHCIQVGMLTYYLAKWMNYSDEEAYLYGRAGFLHDIGKSKIHRTILQKPGKLTDEEYAEIKKHTEYGYEIIMKSLDDRVAAYAALQHHERANGKGYPFGITYEWVHPACKIVAVADIYSAMTSSRTYQRKRDLFIVLKELHDMSFSELDPNVTQTFIRRMIPNFIGKRAQLSDGRIGEIVMNHSTDFFRPLIHVDGEFVDLSKSTLEIQHTIL